MKLRIYTKDTHELVYFCNTTGDPDAPETFEDGGSKAPEIRQALFDWIHGLGKIELEFLGRGDRLTYNALFNIYEDKYIIEVEGLPAPEPEPPFDPKNRKFLIE